MLLYLVIALVVLMIIADCIHYRRLSKRTAKKHTALAIWMGVTNLLPVAVLCLTILSKDNTTQVILITMWILWVWILTVLPRMALYVFRVMRLRRTAWVVAMALVALFLWGATLGRTRIRMESIELQSNRVPASFDGFRIAQVTDLHVGTLISPERELQRMVDSINSLRPDIVVVTGDLVNIRYTELTPKLQMILSKIEAPTYSITGNHDLGTYIKDGEAISSHQNLERLIERQEEMGWQMLQDSTIYLKRGEDSISLSGISYQYEHWSLRHDREIPSEHLDKVYRSVPEEIFNITAVHVPQLWEKIIERGQGDLTLAGHVHSMQMKLKVGKHQFSPASLMYDEWSGRYDEGGHTLYINDGIGYVGYPMRLGAAPEITIIELKRCE